MAVVGIVAMIGVIGSVRVFGQGSPLNCVGANVGCADCFDTEEFVTPFYCDMSGPINLIEGTCVSQTGTCNNWASYNCGEAYRCSDDSDLGVACPAGEYCSAGDGSGG